MPELISRAPSIDWSARVHDFTQFCESAYGLEAHVARLILIALLPSDWRPWLCFDTHPAFFWEHTTKALNTLGWSYRIISMDQMLRIRPRVGNRVMERVLDPDREADPDHSKVCLAVDFDPYSPQDPRGKSRQRELNARMLRYRVHMRRTAYPPHGAENELRRLLENAIRPEHRTHFPGRWTPPGYLQKLAAMVVAVNPELSDWPAFVNNLAAIPPASAALEGRTTLEPMDHVALRGLLRDSMRAYNLQILSIFTQDGFHEVGKLRREVAHIRRPVFDQAIERYKEHGFIEEISVQNTQRFLSLKPGAGTDLQALLDGSVQWW